MNSIEKLREIGEAANIILPMKNFKDTDTSSFSTLEKMVIGKPLNLLPKMRMIILSLIGAISRQYWRMLRKIMTY